MKNTIKAIATAALLLTSTLASAFTKEQAFAAMRQSIENDEFGFDVGSGRSKIIADVRTRHIKKLYTVPGEFPAKPNDQGNVFYYGYMDFKPGLLTSTKKALAVFCPDGNLINWQILNRPGDLKSGWKNGLQSDAVRIRADRYRNALHRKEMEENERKWQEQKAAVARKYQQIQDEKEAAKRQEAADIQRDLKSFSNLGRTLTERETTVVNTAMKLLYKSKNLILEYNPGSLDKKDVVADIKSWSIVAHKRGTRTNPLLVTFDVEWLNDGLLTDRFLVSKVKTKTYESRASQQRKWEAEEGEEGRID